MSPCEDKQNTASVETPNVNLRSPPQIEEDRQLGRLITTI